jgi:hypothetical protein
MHRSGDDLAHLVENATRRVELWSSFIDHANVQSLAEVGVFRGDFARHILDSCPSVHTYVMIDPWRHLENWDKPANRADDVFESYYREAMDKTAGHAERRRVLRGTTTEVADQLDTASLDFGYIDGDHTLRGITVDLARMWPKIRDGGWLAGDDFCRSIHQHSAEYEPTLVFPYAVHFAEAMGARIYALPWRQFLIEKGPQDEHEFIDLTGTYDTTGLRDQLHRPPPEGESPSSGRLRTAVRRLGGR